MKMNVIGLVLVVFLVLSGFLIVKSNNYDLGETDDGISFAKDYSKWLWDTGKKSARVVGSVVKDVYDKEWLPNESNSTNSSSENDNDSDKELKVKLVYD